MRGPVDKFAALPITQGRSYNMTSIQGRHGEASPECFLVTADGLVQSVLRRYNAATDEQALAIENEPVRAATSIA
jgi:hypothetical protein